MGYERKRGKLADLNALLRGAGRERFSLTVGDVSALSGVKFVITLDTDTQLPLDAGRQCVATWRTRSIDRNTTRKSNAWCAAMAFCSRASAPVSPDHTGRPMRSCSE